MNAPSQEDREAWARLSKAADYAFAIHAHQRRKGSGIPYISHLMGVAGLVLEHGGDEAQAVAGLLHDAIEDCGPAQEKAIAERFGPRVARIVRACTDADTFPKPPWRARKEAYLRRLETEDADVLLVSCADKLHNARTIVSDLQTHGPKLFDRFKGGRADTLWYYRALTGAFLRLLPGPLSRDLGEVVERMERISNARNAATAET